jgi:hypothetical protein
MTLIHLRPVPENRRPVLVLHVEKKWFDQIQNGSKVWEYREIKPYWTKRIEGRAYAAVVISNRQNTAFSDPAWLIFPWNGFKKVSGDVYAISLKL